jgi:hypothetical protein
MNSQNATARERGNSLVQPYFVGKDTSFVLFIENTTHADREEQHMFEAIFRITAQVKSDGQGQRVFRITEREAPARDAECLSLLATIYQQEVYPLLRAGDDLTVSVRLDLPPRDLERTVHLREDRLFEAEDMPQATADPLPFMREFYEPLMQLVEPGDVFTITFRVERP